jgi:hypothetical protein
MGAADLLANHVTIEDANTLLPHLTGSMGAMFNAIFACWNTAINTSLRLPSKRNSAKFRDDLYDTHDKFLLEMLCALSGCIYKATLVVAIGTRSSGSGHLR